MYVIISKTFVPSYLNCQLIGDLHGNIMFAALSQLFPVCIHRRELVSRAHLVK